MNCDISKELERLKNISSTLCLICKGSRLLCGRPYCPLMKAYQLKKPIELKLKEKIYSPTPPSIFVGYKGYPNVYFGPLNSLTEESPEILDDPSKWYGMDYDKIIELRTSLVRSKTPVNVRKPNKFVEKIQEISLSVKNVHIETEFKRKPHFELKFSKYVQPLGPSGELKNLKITENPKIPMKVEKIINDKQKASDQIFQLYKRGFDVYYIVKVFSSGILGTNKRMVPTRWSITGVDDIISNKLIEKIKTYPEIDKFYVWSNTYLDNHFEILMIPGKWFLEVFEAWSPNTLWTLGKTKPVIQVEREGWIGRKNYAEKEGGGYYASKLAVTEQLEKMKRQATVIVFREIYESYIIPVGVWEIRENIRHAFMKKPERFDTLEDALRHIGEKIRIDMKEFKKKSYILNQKTLQSFI